MDPHQNLTASINSADLKPITESTVDRLPNELIQLIFAKLELDGDVKKLIRLRLVSTKWRDQIEDYCQMKKSLIVALDKKTVSCSIYFSQLKKQFFGFANSKDFSCLCLSTEISSQCLSSLVNLFPNIVQLSIHCFEQRPVRGFSLYINSLASLAQLDLVGPFVSALSDHLSAASLSKLEHLSIESNGLKHMKDNKDHGQLVVSHLGPRCVRVYFDISDLNYHRTISQWHAINPNWLANLTHLRMCIYGEDENEKLIKFLSEHSASLKLLNLIFIDRRYLGSPLKISPPVIRDLARLTNLTELKLWNTKMNVPELEHAATQHRLTSLSSVLTCKLYASEGNRISGNRLTRVLSVIFPNLAKLHLDLVQEGNFSPLQHEIEQHLYRFRNLREHKIVVPFINQHIQVANS